MRWRTLLLIPFAVVAPLVPVIGLGLLASRCSPARAIPQPAAAAPPSLPPMEFKSAPIPAPTPAAPAQKPALAIPPEFPVVNGKSQMDIENICRAFMANKLADVSFPGWRDMGVDQGKPVAFDAKGNATWRSWARLEGHQRWFLCRYTAASNMVSVRWV